MKLSEGDVFMPGEAVQQLEITNVKFWMEPFIPHDSIVLAHGKFSTAKTPIMSNIAKAIAMGSGEILGYPIYQGRVLFIQADTPKDVIVPRLKQLDVAIPNFDFAFCYPGFDILNPFKDEADQFYYALLHKAHRTNPYNVVFIDALRGIHVEDDKESNTVHKVYRSLRKLFPGATVVLIHHDKKFSSDSSGDETFSGSQAWANHATVALKFSCVSRKDEIYKLEHTKSQASEMVPAVEIKLKDGMKIVEKKAEELGEIGEALVNLKVANPGITNEELDRRIADFYNFSVRTARRRREEVEARSRSATVSGQIESGQH